MSTETNQMNNLPPYKTLSSGFTHKLSISSIVHRTFSSGSHWQAINGTLGLRVPAQVTKTKCVQYMRRGKPSHRTQLINDTAYSIVAQYQAEYRGVVQYYRLAYNLHQLSKLKRVMEVSLVKTLANKYKTSCGDIYKRFKTEHTNADGTYKVLEVRVEREPDKKPLVAQFGGIPLLRPVLKGLGQMISRDQNAVITKLLCIRLWVSPVIWHLNSCFHAGMLS